MSREYNREILLLLISSLFLLLVMIFGCNKSTDIYDPILVSIKGTVYEYDSLQPLDSVLISQYVNDEQVFHNYTDSSGYFFVAPIGFYKGPIETLLRFEKTGYITKDTTMLIAKQGDRVDSLIIYLNTN